MKNKLTKPNPHQPPSVKTKVLTKIESDGVTPRAKWLCQSSGYLVWLLWMVTVVIGALAVAEAIYVSMHSGFEFFEFTHGTLLQFAISSLPYIWILVFVLFVALAYFNLRQTKRGYKYPFWQMILSNVVLTLLIGFSFYFFGLGKIIDQVLTEMPMPLRSTEEKQAYMWAHPEDGRITGVFKESLPTPMQIRFVDSVDREWTVEYSELVLADIDLLLSEERVRLIGEANVQSVPNPESNLFYVCVVMPWMAKDGESLKSIMTNREKLYERMIQFGTDKPIDPDSPLRCRRILHDLVPTALESQTVN